MLIPTMLRARAGSEQTEPRTILGFLLAFFTVVAATLVLVVTALVSTGHPTIAAVALAAVFVLAVTLLGWIAVTHTRNPAALMIGQSTTRDYLAVEQWTAGDSNIGEYLRAVPPTLPGAMAALPPGTGTELGDIAAADAEDVERPRGLAPGKPEAAEGESQDDLDRGSTR